MTLQDYFNIAWDHAVVRKEPPSFIEGTSRGVQCLYRGPNGTRCLIGAAIPDESYHLEFEGKSAYTVLSKCKCNMCVPYEIDFLQQCHDDCCFCPDYHDRVAANLRAFAKEYNLAIPELK